LPETKYTTVTARLERAPRSRVFRRPWEQRRCVVPMNGYYKWDRTARPPQPYFIQAQSGAMLFAAGLWDHWHKDVPELHSFAILTHANPAIPPPLVPDGPVFLPADAVGTWIAGPLFPLRYLTRMRQPAMEAYPVSRRIRSREVDDYTLLEPVDPQADAIDAVGFDAASEDEDDDEDL
jgi:putative SOS response-associated peptidase YedK